ncbi:MAG: ORF6N domain-containing protein [Candidatus Margulisbacteria bacterium]|nr:ORF6N domain-containing protein [Candidatus Margulisiibacteriota bacterium]
MNKLILQETIANKIYYIRGQKVMLDKDLAVLYGIRTKVLLQSMKRNIKRFPEDFMFQLDQKEYSILRSQFVTSKWGGRRYFPYVFTEQGVAMLSSVLKSERAIEVNIVIMRAFVKLRKIFGTHKELAEKLKNLESRIKDHDEEIRMIFEAIRQLMKPPDQSIKKIGFKV